MTTEVAVSEARAILAELVQRVLDGDEITLTRHGQPVAVLVRPDALRHRRAADAFAAADALRRQLDEARTRPLGSKGMGRQRTSALVRELRADRDGR